MRKIVFLIVFLCSINLYSQSIDLNFVMIAEVGSTDCSDKENTFFITKVLNSGINNIMDRHKVLESVRENYMDVLAGIINADYPEYSNSNCISDLYDWKFFEEWSTTSEGFKEYIDQKYSIGKIIEVDFILKTESNTIIIEEKKKEIDPNQALIDAYYTQALAEYQAKNFTKTTVVLDKVKGLIGDKVNLDVMLLEAKTKSEIDKNINEAKDILNQFVKEAAKQNDEKLSDGANFLVSLETSDLYHESGYKKEFKSVVKTDSDVLTIVDKLDENGDVVFSKQLSKNWNDAVIKEVDNSISGEQKITNYNRYNTVESEEYYLNGSPVLVVFAKQKKVEYYHEGKRVQMVIYNKDKVNVSVFNANGDLIYNIENIKITDTKPLNLSRTLSLEFVKQPGKVLEIKEDLEKEEFNMILFDSDGLPQKKSNYKREGKVRETFKFDLSSSSWTELD